MFVDVEVQPGYIRYAGQATSDMHGCIEYVGYVPSRITRVYWVCRFMTYELQVTILSNLEELMTMTSKPPVTIR